VKEYTQPVLTVFTPTYNRAGLLPRAYEALLRQTSYNFEWLIVDDGSTDNTRQLVADWQKRPNPFKITYVFKENGGLHTGYNAAIERLTTELAVCVDSDDFLPDDAVERIVNFWEQHGSPEYAGIIGLDYSLAGNIIGDPLPAQKSVNLIDLAVGRYKIRNGDRKNVVRSDLYKLVAPMPVFGREKNFNPHYMHLQISREYDFLVLNENLCFVDYQDSGMSGQIYRQYLNSPRSFAEIRKFKLSIPDTPILFRLRHYIHYVSSCLLARRRHGLRNPDWPLLVLAAPFGAALSLFILFQVWRMDRRDRKTAGKSADPQIQRAG